MKLRIKGNSIRLRLTRSEVELLGSEGTIFESVHFGTGSAPFVYELRTTDDNKVSATFMDRGIVVSLPASAADQWINSEEVGIEALQPIDAASGLRILIEKDFACLTRGSAEDESDAFQNPLAVSR